MGQLKLVTPSEEYKRQILEYKEEFEESGDSLDGTAGLRTAESFEEWLHAMKCNSSEETVAQGLVPASTYMALREKDGYLIGMIDIRHRLNEGLKKRGGHIGYSVRKSERRQGYASEMLSLALVKCAELAIDKVLITCAKDNLGSAGTIKKNQGVLENEIEGQDTITQRYWITLP